MGCRSPISSGLYWVVLVALMISVVHVLSSSSSTSQTAFSRWSLGAVIALPPSNAAAILLQCLSMVSQSRCLV